MARGVVGLLDSFLKTPFIAGHLGPSLKHSLASRSRPGDPPPFVNGVWRRWASRSIPQAFPCVPLTPWRPAALRKWRAASLAFPVHPPFSPSTPAHAPVVYRP
ncbi:hypothetical protein K488DRAFT_92904 [Vararia minispora EC-137]|uniref:Uncharacterized protein n=1 Tax=Vararia minispora EC-137 TaxID=1314806 RepID=A0ACB8Q3C8_9AGAM|nr:hypothetical protein K488DRAFT_92904 [Vararia minispora EC-137]